GPHPIRKWERRVVLSAEYAVKALYAGLVRVVTRYLGSAEDSGIHVLAENVSDQVLADARIRKVKAVGPRAYLLRLPRHEAFTAIVPALTRQGVRFRDIAGNQEIFLTAPPPRPPAPTVACGAPAARPGPPRPTRSCRHWSAAARRSSSSTTTEMPTGRGADA